MRGPDMGEDSASALPRGGQGPGQKGAPGSENARGGRTGSPRLGSGGNARSAMPCITAAWRLER